MCVCVGVVFCYCQNCWQLLYVMLVTQPSSNQQRVGQEINTTSDELNLGSSKNTFHSAWLRRSWAELLAKSHTHTTDNNKKKYNEKVNNNNNNISSASKRNQPTKSIVRRCCFVCDPLQSRVGFVSFCGALCLLLLFNFSTLTTSKRTFFYRLFGVVWFWREYFEFHKFSLMLLPTYVISLFGGEIELVEWMARLDWCKKDNEKGVFVCHSNWFLISLRIEWIRIPADMD